MDNLTLIAAIGNNNELGYQNKLIWHLKGDMKFFKDNTYGKPILMGIKTLYSLPKLLPGREHIVLTHQDIEIEGVKVFHEKSELLDYIRNLNREVMVIGGASIYQQFIHEADKMLLTEIEATSYADVYFPKIDALEWDVRELKRVKENNIAYTHVEYKRRKM